MKHKTPHMLQYWISIFLIVCAVVLAFIGVFTEPIGEIHNSILILFAEVLGFVGAVLNIDYKYASRHSAINRKLQEESHADEND